jgi:hypothetical protein
MMARDASREDVELTISFIALIDVAGRTAETSI